MKFVDEVTITVEAGKGGAGARSFRREKYVPFGGPDGGNGGRGGSVIVVADRNKRTLLDFKYHPQWKAQNGQGGAGSRREGKSGKDLLIPLPVGTQVIDQSSGEIRVDLVEDGQRFVLAKGGRGGKGNEFFKSATNQAPEHAQPGEPGEAGTFVLSLKLLADLGLVGFPNAGKSTLISRISSARPKIADYPFTTLVPNLGVVQAKGGRTFVVADIPGLIPGAHEGKGLGIKFLKHVERTRSIAHLIDVGMLDKQGQLVKPLDAFKIVNNELKEFSQELAEKPQIIVLTKADTSSDRESLTTFKREFVKLGHDCHIISSATGEGIEELIEAMARAALEEQQS